jgi:hypothetical protein
MDITISILLLFIAWSWIGLLGFWCWYGCTERPGAIHLAAMVFFGGPIVWIAYLDTWWNGGEL